MTRWLAVALLAGAVFAGWIIRDLETPYRGFTGSTVVEIEPGSSTLSIAELLTSQGVLAHRIPFLVRYAVGRGHGRLKAGEYLFDRPLRPLDVYRKLLQGDVYLYQVLIPEGSDRFDIARILQARLGIDPADFLHTTEQTALIHDLDPQAPSLEGYLFPDTYRFPRSTNAAAVALTMVTRFRRILASRFHNELPTANLHEAVTLASLVEKETPDPVERPLVAEVFTRRIEKDMPLQCDPTVIYAAELGRRATGHITAEDLNSDSPFNTYRHAGLPPGPIANPGESALRAAFHPAAGKNLYFVSNNHGGHVFAETLTEHQHNVALYRRELAAERRKAEQAAAPRAETTHRTAKGKVSAKGRARPSRKPEHKSDSGR